MNISPAARLMALIVGCLACAALAAQFVVNYATEGHFGAPVVLWRMARFFTILTNGMVVVTFLRAAVSGRSPGPALAGGVALWIGVTGLVYYGLLYRETNGLAAWADLGLHGVVPVSVVVWWAVFSDKTGLAMRSALLWLIWPLAYVVYALVRGGYDGQYPYFFTDPIKVGWDGVALWSLALCVGFFVAGLGLIALGRVMGPRA